MKKGFTLVELLAVTVLLGLIMAVAYPTLFKIFDDKEDEIDLSVGVLLNKTLYDEVKTDDTLLTIYYNKTKPDISNIENAFKVESIIKKKEDIIKSVIK